MLLLFLVKYFAFVIGKKDKTFTLRNNSSNKLQDLLDFVHHQICLNSYIIKIKKSPVFQKQPRQVQETCYMFDQLEYFMIFEIFTGHTVWNISKCECVNVTSDTVFVNNPEAEMWRTVKLREQPTHKWIHMYQIVRTLESMHISFVSVWNWACLTLLPWHKFIMI